MEEKESETTGRHKRNIEEDRGWVAKRERVKQWGVILMTNSDKRNEWIRRER